MALELEESKTGYNDVEIEALLSEFMDQNPQFLKDHQEEFDEAKIDAEIKNMERKLFTEQFQTCDAVYDQYE